MIFFDNLSNNQKYTLLVILLTISTFSIFLISTNIIYALLSVAIIYLIILITKTQESKVIISISAIGFLTTLLACFTPNFWQPIIQHFLLQLFPNLPIQNNQIPDIIILVLMLLGLIIILYWVSRDSTSLGKLIKPIDSYFPERDFKSLFKSVCEELENDLRNIDRKTNWSTQNFVPLDAEVEIITKNRKQRKVTDLLTAIKKSKKDRVFLILGDPGSGKSVALRKLCRDLLKRESEKTGKLPIYINLKEWRLNTPWDENNPPTVNQLNEFVLNTLYSGDICTANFFREHYAKLYEIGSLYFILDSFDEIPAVLNEKENSILVDKLSEVVFKFLKGARGEESQGILASRLFRKPTEAFQTKITLEIRPFSEIKIVEGFKKRFPTNAENIVKRIFKERADLASMIRNPFLSTLVSDYISTYKELPENKSITYSSYINTILENEQIRIKLTDLNISKNEILEIASVIAQEMFEQKTLEIPINIVRKKYPNLKIEDTINILKFGKLGRGNEADENQFSFVHRRFAEYFFVQSIIKQNIFIDLNSIPNDSQMRDALVLYCEIVPFHLAKDIANFCWKTIQAHPLKSKETIHSLRFLTDAFNGRRECLEDFQNEFARFIQNKVETNSDILSIKIVLESLPLLQEEYIDQIVYKVFKFRNSWLNEVAIKACRHLACISDHLEYSIGEYIICMKLTDYIKKYKELRFSFSLSDTFYKLKNVTVLKFIDPFRYGLLFIIIYSLVYSEPERNYVSSLNEKSSYYSELIKLSDNVSSWIFTLLFFIFIDNYSTRMNPFKKYSLSYYYLTKGKKLNIPKTINSLFKTLMLGFLYVIVLCLSLLLIITFNYLPQTYMSYILNGGMSIVVLMLIALIVTLLLPLINDYQYFKKNTVINFKTRSELEEYYSSLRTEYFRSKFITNIENDNISNIIGKWSEGFMKVSDVPSKTRLAQLDEKWLGLKN